ncbi:MAG: hypothetical protein SPE38_03595, partial [Prevotella sp.]|nr:hypothetical protein [Prevotella sp.]
LEFKGDIFYYDNFEWVHGLYVVSYCYRIFKVSLAAESRIIFLGSLFSPPNEHVDRACMLMFFPNTLSACARELQSGEHSW